MDSESKPTVDFSSYPLLKLPELPLVEKAALIKCYQVLYYFIILLGPYWIT